MSKYVWKLPIGDWSGDGHSVCNYFFIESNKSLQECREIYFSIKEKLGVCPEDVCNEYQDSRITIEELKSLGIKPEDFFVDPLEEEEGEWILGEDEIVDLFLRYMMNNSEDLTLKIIQKDVEMFPFYGFDEKKRHIGFIGYGVFE